MQNTTEDICAENSMANYPVLTTRIPLFLAFIFYHELFNFLEVEHVLLEGRGKRLCGADTSYFRLWGL